MGYGHSLDLRKRIVEAVQSGSSARAVARRFGVSASSAIILVGRWRETGSYAPGQVGGQKRRRLPRARVRRPPCPRLPGDRRPGGRLHRRLDQAPGGICAEALRFQAFSDWLGPSRLCGRSRSRHASLAQRVGVAKARAHRRPRRAEG